MHVGLYIDNGESHRETLITSERVQHMWCFNLIFSWIENFKLTEVILKLIFYQLQFKLWHLLRLQNGRDVMALRKPMVRIALSANSVDVKENVKQDLRQSNL